MTEVSFAAEVAELESADRRAAEESIKVLHGVRQGRRAFELEEKAARVPLDNFFRTHPEEKELIDPEAGLRAYLRPGGKSMSYDAPSAIKERDPVLYRRLEELGCFAIDGAKLELAFKSGQLVKRDVAGYVSEGERTAALIVEEIKA